MTDLVETLSNDGLADTERSGRAHVDLRPVGERGEPVGHQGIGRGLREPLVVGIRLALSHYLLPKFPLHAADDDDVDHDHRDCDDHVLETMI